MTNYLQMPKKQHVLALLELHWTYRRIEAETGVRRETVSRYDRARLEMRPRRSPARTRRPPAIARAYPMRLRQMRPKRSPARPQTRPQRSPARRLGDGLRPRRTGARSRRNSTPA